MNAQAGQAATARAVAAPARIQSVDVLRGLTILVMIFVNDLAGVRGLPWWTYHMPPGVDGMTYVDVVYPAFLFIVGLSLPIAIANRLRKGDSMLRVWSHVAARSVTLMVLGIFLANSGKVDRALTGLSGGAWTVLGLLAAVLLWNVYPRTGPRALFRAMRIAGLAGLVVVFALFRRRAPDGTAAWLDFGYWEILGLIGRAYLAACILYLPLRGRRWAPFALLALLTGMNVAAHSGWLGFLRQVPYWAWPFDRGEFPSIILAGVCASTLVLGGRGTVSRRAITARTLAFAGALFLAGWIFRPLGLTKLGAMPSWCLWCSALCTVLFLALYWVCDVKRSVGWAALFRPAGANTLLTYLLPDLSYAAFGSLHLGSLTRHGWPGAVKAAVFTFAILGVAALLTRLKVRMQI